MDDNEQLLRQGEGEVSPGSRVCWNYPPPTPPPEPPISPPPVPRPRPARRLTLALTLALTLTLTLALTLTLTLTLTPTRLLVLSTKKRPMLSLGSASSRLRVCFWHELLP